MGGYCGKCHRRTAGPLVLLARRRRLLCTDCFRRVTGRYPLPSCDHVGLLAVHLGQHVRPTMPGPKRPMAALPFRGGAGYTRRRRGGFMGQGGVSPDSLRDPDIPLGAVVTAIAVPIAIHQDGSDEGGSDDDDDDDDAQ